MIQVTINYFAVLGAAVASFIVGSLWYGPLFGKYWKRLMGLTEKNMKSMKISVAKAMSLGFISTLVMAFVLAYFMGLLEATTIAAALDISFWIWLGFSMPLCFGSYLWEGKSLQLFLLNAAYRLVELCVMAIVLTL